MTAATPVRQSVFSRHIVAGHSDVRLVASAARERSRTNLTSDSP
jgi:hypothetical protein